MIAWLMLWKWRARLTCHGTRWCCQYTDRPLCNLWNDPHWDARWRYRRRARIEMREEQTWENRHHHQAPGAP